MGSRLQYAGPSLLEVRDEELAIKTSDGTANLVRWKLAHIRSFKARKDTLTVFSGRSVVGRELIKGEGTRRLIMLSTIGRVFIRSYMAEGVPRIMSNGSCYPGLPI